MRAAWAAALLAARAAAGGCSLSDDEPSGGGEADPGAAVDGQTVTGTRTVERTKVDVDRATSARTGRSTRAAIYEELGPGVVTVISIFGERRRPGGGEGGLGSGFVLDGEGYVATNAHVVTGRAARSSSAPTTSTSSSPTATASRRRSSAPT